MILLPVKSIFDSYEGFGRRGQNVLRSDRIRNTAAALGDRRRDRWTGAQLQGTGWGPRLIQKKTTFSHPRRTQGRYRLMRFFIYRVL